MTAAPFLHGRRGPRGFGRVRWAEAALVWLLSLASPGDCLGAVAVGVAAAAWGLFGGVGDKEPVLLLFEVLRASVHAVDYPFICGYN